MTSQTPVCEVLSVDELDFEVRRSGRRRTLQLTIDRGGELILSAPESLSPRAMREFVRDKKVWIYSKLALKLARRSEPVRKEFVTGEGFNYLGRSHRLVLVDDQDVPLLLDHGCFRLRRADVDRAREHFVRWYTARAKMWLERRAAAWAPRLDVKPGGLRVLDLGHRWGSCGKAGTLNFHWNTILLPPSIVEYVVVHELVHLREPNHTPAFWRAVEAVLPDLQLRREWLVSNGAQAVAW
jgi:predicted metal-dependent hydrolase